MAMKKTHCNEMKRKCTRIRRTEDKTKYIWVKVVDAHIKMHLNGKWSYIRYVNRANGRSLARTEKKMSKFFPLFNRRRKNDRDSEQVTLILVLSRTQRWFALIHTTMCVCVFMYPVRIFPMDAPLVLDVILKNFEIDEKSTESIVYFRRQIWWWTMTATTMTVLTVTCKWASALQFHFFPFSQAN